MPNVVESQREFETRIAGGRHEYVKFKLTEALKALGHEVDGLCKIDGYYISFDLTEDNRWPRPGQQAKPLRIVIGPYGQRKSFPEPKAGFDYEKIARAMAGLAGIGSWMSTPKQIKDTIGAERLCFLDPNAIAKFEFVPITKIDYIDFESKAYKSKYKDPKGDSTSYIAGLMMAMKTGVKLPPAVGLVQQNGSIVAHDGNHRICAARKLGIKKIPMLVFKR